MHLLLFQCHKDTSSRGKAHRHTKHMRKTVINHSSAIPPLYLLLKDHKKPDNGLHPTRPVVSSNKGMNLFLNDLLHDYLQPIQDNMRGSEDISSTEEALHRIDNLNSILRQKKLDDDMSDIPVYMVGADIVGLYTNLSKASVTNSVYKAALESKLTWCDTNYGEALRYLTSLLEPWE